MLVMLKTTWPMVGPILRRSKRVVVLLAALGALAGYLATFSSMVESELLNLAVRDSTSGPGGLSISDAMRLPLAQGRVINDDSGVEGQVLNSIIAI